MKNALAQLQEINFRDGTLAAAVDILAAAESDPITQACLFEAARKLRWSVVELVRLEGISDA